MSRFLRLWLVAAGLFTVAWTAGYHLLPEGALRGKLLAAYLPVEAPTVASTFLRIFAANAVLGCGFILFASLFRVGRTSLGGVLAVNHGILYGLLLGTNSFGIPAPGRFAPSLATVLGRSGAFEITAYVAVAAATYRLGIWQQRSLLDLRSERIGSLRGWRLDRSEILVIIGAVLLLMAAAYREAVQIHALPF